MGGGRWCEAASEKQAGRPLSHPKWRLWRRAKGHGARGRMGLTLTLSDPYPGHREHPLPEALGESLVVMK